MPAKEREEVSHYCDFKDNTNRDECHCRVVMARYSCRDQLQV
jgi:hypothetical protein